MALKTTAVVHMENGDDILVTSNMSPMTYALDDVKMRILNELDMHTSEWLKIEIVINRV